MSGKKTYKIYEAVAIIVEAMIRSGKEVTSKEVAFIIADLTGGKVSLPEENKSA